MVPGYRRNTQPLDVLNKAETAIAEVLRVTNKEKIFPLKRKRELADPLVQNCRELGYALQFANNMSLWHIDQRKIRRTQQFKALECVSRAMIDVKLAQSILHLNGGTFEHLIDVLTNVRKLTVQWMRSDSRRIIDGRKKCMEAIEKNASYTAESGEIITPDELEIEAEFADEALPADQREVVANLMASSAKFSKYKKLSKQQQHDIEVKDIYNSQELK